MRTALVAVTPKRPGDRPTPPTTPPPVRPRRRRAAARAARRLRRRPSAVARAPPRAGSGAAARRAPSVQVQPLSPLDLFSAGRDTGLGPDLWKGSSADLARVVIPTLADHPLSPAAAALARRVLGAAAAAPDGAGEDADLAAARARALLALGDAAGRRHDPRPHRRAHHSAALSQTAAEAALIGDQDDKACAIGDALAVDRGGALLAEAARLLPGPRRQAAAAQLTVNLADQQGHDPVFDRMIAVIIAGAGDPGPAVAGTTASTTPCRSS